MSIIGKYIGREVLTFFAVVLVAVVFIYLAIDFFEKIDKFIESGQPLSKAVTYFLFKIPLILIQIMPAGLLLAILFSLGIMNRNNEVLALRCGGISHAVILKPLLLLGFAAAAILFFLAEGLVPTTMSRANQIWYQDVRKERAVTVGESDIWIRGQQSITYIRHYAPREKTIYNLSHHIFDDRFQMIRRLDANLAVYTDEGWILFDVLEQDVTTTEPAVRTDTHAQLAFPLEFEPEDLQRVIKKPEEMGFAELLALARKIEADGYDATVHRVNVAAKTAYPFICVIMSLVGMGMALRAGLREGLVIRITYGIGTAFIYWILYSFCLSLGYGGILPPFLAAWSANVIFAAVGVLMIVNLQFQ